MTKGIKVYDIILTGADSMTIIEYSDKYLEDVKDLLVELEEYIDRLIAGKVWRSGCRYSP